MATSSFTESVIEQGALAWLESVGWQVHNGAVRVEVKLDRDTVWLTQRQMSDLFEATPKTC